MIDQLEARPADRAALSPAAFYLSRLSPGTRKRTQRTLEAIAALIAGAPLGADVLPWQKLRYEHTQAIRAALAERYAPATVNVYLAALRGTLKECWRLELMTDADYHRAIDVENISSETLPAGRELQHGELRALTRSCADGSSAGARDAALLAVLYAGGLRRAEARAEVHERDLVLLGGQELRVGHLGLLELSVPRRVGGKKGRPSRSGRALTLAGLLWGGASCLDGVRAPPDPRGLAAGPSRSGLLCPTNQTAR